MEIGEILENSYDYTKEGLVGKWVKWVILAVLWIIQILPFGLPLLPIFNGYIIRVMSGAEPAPEIDQWEKLFVDGWKLNIIVLIYMLIPLIVLFVFGGFAALSAIASSAAGGDPSAISAVMLSLFGGIIIAGFLAIIISIFAVIGIVRFARTDSIGEAFNFSAILETIGNIGWIEYIIALVILLIVLLVIQFITWIFMVIPPLGTLIGIIVAPAIAIFSARYMTLLYESGAS